MAAQAQAMVKPPGEAEVSLSPRPGGDENQAEARWEPLLGLSCELTVDLAMPEFKIADLLVLRPGSVINSKWRVGHDVPLRLNGTPIGWIEFEVVAERLAVRLTELV